MIAWVIACVLAGSDAALIAIIALLVKQQDRMMKALSAQYRIETEQIVHKGHFSLYKPKGDE